MCLAICMAEFDVYHKLRPSVVIFFKMFLHNKHVGARVCHGRRHLRASGSVSLWPHVERHVITGSPALNNVGRFRPIQSRVSCRVPGATQRLVVNVVIRHTAFQQTISTPNVAVSSSATLHTSRNVTQETSHLCQSNWPIAPASAERLFRVVGNFFFGWKSTVSILYSSCLTLKSRVASKIFISHRSLSILLICFVKFLCSFLFFDVASGF